MLGKKTYVAAGLCMVALAGNIAWAAEEEKPKRVIKGNSTPEYLVLPQPVDNFRDAFVKGMYYGRLRSNLFYYYYDEENEGAKQKDNRSFGLGGSLIYKTAPLNGFSATAGLYTSQNPIEGINMDKEDAVKFAKSGKDAFSREKLYDDGDYDGHWGMTTLAEAFLEYQDFGFDVKFGRQIYESFLTNSNDSKMIPNTFEGLSVGNTSIPATTVSAAYLTKQKLRDHEEFHDVIAYGTSLEIWDGNDDSGAHKGLTKTKLNEEDIDSELLVLGLTNKGIKDLTLDAAATVVPDLFWSGMIEANYQISLAEGWSLTPGLRYMQQFDDGAGKIGGAALSGTLANHAGEYKGYEDADSVDGSMWGGRLVLKKGAGSLSAAYTSIADEADLIAPWRGFPTGGYTRDIAQVNWEANTDSWMVKYDYDFDKAGLVWGLKASLDYVIMNYDEIKEELGGFTKTDARQIHLDLWQDIPHAPGLRAVVRIAQYSADDRKHASYYGVDPSYWEWRFGLDYLF
jgi:hypothetical protein